MGPWMSRQEEHVVPRSAEAIVWRRQSLPVVVVQMIIIVGLLSAVAFVKNVPEEVVLHEEKEPDGTTIAWKVSEEGNNWVIEIIDVPPESLDEVSWSILNLNRLVATWDDPSGDMLRMEGDMININFSQTEYNEAEVKDSNKFYSRDRTGTPPVRNNHTLCIVYMDVNSDGKLSNGDAIFIRSNLNGGAAFEDFRFRMVNEKISGGGYGEKILPPLTGSDTYEKGTGDRARAVADRFGSAILGLALLNFILILMFFILPFGYRRGKRNRHLLEQRSTILLFIISAIGILLLLIIFQVLLLFSDAFISNAHVYSSNIRNWVLYTFLAFLTTYIFVPFVPKRNPSFITANSIVITSLVTAITVPTFAEAIDQDPFLWFALIFTIVIVVVSSMLILMLKGRRSGYETNDGQ